jgi:hypothetical protein
MGASAKPALAIAAVIERAVDSPQFSKSPRSQELLRFLCDSALKDPQAPITEHQIGAAIFGWSQDHDYSSDTIVRVHVSQLRKKLEHYFLTEGQDEPVVIHIPRGSYVPQFEDREQVSRPPVPRRSRWRLVLAGVAILAAGAAIALWPGRAPSGPSAAATPALDRFWTPFRNNRSVQIVVSDANLILLSEMMGRTVSLREYRYRTYPQHFVDLDVKSPEMRQLAGRLLMTHTTGMQDATVSAAITVWLSRYQIPVSSISAQDFRMPQPDNLVFLGHPKGNPWVELFEDRLSFSYQFDWKNRKGSIISRPNAPGGPGVHTATFGNEGYCVVACLPKPMGDGAALVIFGSDMSSLEAGGRFVTNEESINNLYRRLHVTPKDAPPYVEVLLHTRLFENLAPGYDIIAHTTPKF